MKRFRIVLLSMVAACTIGAIGAGSASAGNGYVTAGGAPCDVTFNNTGGPTDPTPNSITLDNIVEVPSDPDCAGVDFINPVTSMSINFAGNGLLTGTGMVRVDLTISGAICTFDATSVTGSNSANTAVIFAAFTLFSGPGSCPPSLPLGHLSVLSF
ncbi:MAG TPA: hypothetical protein VMF31_03865 [Solirubrobacterales bacterium]|nr:hypothetical protein [Solirubrobacterales bacterium]